MALDLQGLFVNPATMRQQRIDDLMQQRQQLTGMGGSMAGLLGQVAGGGNILGQQLAEGLARGMGLKTATEKEQEQINKVIKEVDTTNATSLMANASKLQKVRPDVANQMRERAVAITSAAHKAEMDRIQQDKDNLFRARELGLKAETLNVRREELEQREADAEKRHNREMAALRLDQRKASDDRELSRAEYIKDMYKNFTVESVYNHLYKGGALVKQPKEYEPTAEEKRLMATGLDPSSPEFQEKMMEIVEAKIAKDTGSGDSNFQRLTESVVTKKLAGLKDREDSQYWDVFTTRYPTKGERFAAEADILRYANENKVDFDEAFAAVVLQQPGSETGADPFASLFN